MAEKAHYLQGQAAISVTSDGIHSRDLWLRFDQRMGSALNAFDKRLGFRYGEKCFAALRGFRLFLR